MSAPYQRMRLLDFSPRTMGISRLTARIEASGPAAGISQSEGRLDRFDGMTLQRAGKGSAPASLLKTSIVAASRGSSRITFSSASAVSGEAFSPEIF